jgi:3'-5' exoribonuclease
MNKEYTNPDHFDLKWYSQKFNKDVESIASVVIDDERFPIWWGGLTGQHHAFNGGLARHTKEVVELAFASIKTLGIEKQIDKTELFLACLFHDAGKMFDYEKNPKYGYTIYNNDGSKCPPEPEFIAAPHKRMIHHISRSALIWSHAVAKVPELNAKYHDNVLHAILAHHGQREWGSPVMPKSRVAWLLHLSDGISARISDCETIDFVYANRK